MSYYRYQYKQQCYIPGGMKCGQCPPCAKVCGVRKTLQSPGCSPCSSGCVETHLVQSHSSSSSCCSPRSPRPCPMTFPQPQCGQAGVRRCPQVCGPAPQVCAPAPQVCAPAPQVCVSPPQVCAPAPQVCAPAALYQHSSYPYSYQWSNSYQYNCGQQ